MEGFIASGFAKSSGDWRNFDIFKMNIDKFNINMKRTPFPVSPKGEMMVSL